MTRTGSSDGTEGGTVQVKDINPNAGNSYPRYPTNAGGTLYFQANDGTNGAELWKSNGTEAGTTLVKDIRPGAPSSAPRYLTTFDGMLFFTAVENTNGLEPWKSDGTTEGTTLVKNIFPGLGESNSRYLTESGGTLFFTAHDNFLFNDELWRVAIPRQVSIDDVTLNEAAGTATLTVSATPGSVAARFDYATADGTATAGDDYTQGSGTKTIPDNAASTAIEVPITDDPADEPDETFTVTLASADSATTVARATATVTITDDDAAANPPSPPPPPDNDFGLPGKGKRNLKTGALTLEINLPGAGTLSAAQQGTTTARFLSFAKSKALIKPTTKQAVAGKNTLVLKPSKKGLKKLKKAAKGPKTGKLKVPVQVTFTPAGGTLNAEDRTYKLKLK